jgi:hypothetical protein
VSSSEHDLAEAARVLAQKAVEDATAVREFASNSEIADSIIGFHALCGSPHKACYADLRVMPT